MTASMTGVGATIVIILNAVLPLFGIEVEEGVVAQGVMGVVNFVGFVLLIVGQARRPEVTGFIFKKE
jgi:hypothetical protein